MSEKMYGELLFSCIMTLNRGCYFTSSTCINCPKSSECRVMYIHDALGKLGIPDKEFVKLRDWAYNWMINHPRN